MIPFIDSEHFRDSCMMLFRSFITPFVLILTISSCSSDSDTNSTTAPETLIGSWAGTCENATQGSQRPIIAFSASRVSVRTFLYLGTSTCSGDPSRSSDRTSGEYTELGGAGLETKINITNLFFNTREQARHESVLPRSFDIYYIENGLLYYGDYTHFDGSTESRRPVIYENASVATYLGSDTSSVF